MFRQYLAVAQRWAFALGALRVLSLAQRVLRPVARHKVGDHSVRDWVEIGLGHARSAHVRLLYRRHRVARRVIVCGSPRSGTTWLAELINHDGRHRLVFEPEDAYHRTDRFTAFAPTQYLRVDENDPRFTEPLRELFDGRVFSRYSDNWDRRVRLRPADDLLVKFVNGNLFCGWIAHNITPSAVIHIVRHPLAVLRSQVELGFPDHGDLLTGQAHLSTDVLDEFRPVIDSVSTNLERRIVEWCIHQLVPIRQLPTETALTIRYEDLLLDPEPGLKAVFSTIGLAWDPAVLGLTDRPSQTTWRGAEFASAPRAHVESWRSAFSQDEIDRCHDIVDAFGLGHLYGDHAEYGSAVDVRSYRHRELEPDRT